MKKLLVLFLCVTQLMGFSLFETAHDEDMKYLQLLDAVKNAVITTQKTRGLTNNFMNGNVSAQLLVYGQRTEMMKNFDQINAALEPLKKTALFNEAASALMIRSQVLNKKAFKSDSAKTFAAYSKIIEGWIDFNRVVIEHHFSKGPKDTYTMVSIVNNVLLPLTENIGKMRGLGSGIVARTYCKEEESLKMRAFVKEIDQYRTGLMSYLQGKRFEALSQLQIDQVNQYIQEYTHLTQQRVIDQKAIELDTNGYFDQGTSAISDVLRIYSTMMEVLKKP